MQNRLHEIIKYKTGGHQTEFAALIGWSPQYLAKLLKGLNFGINPVMAILEKFPEINARWFLFGQGDMLESDKLRSLHSLAFNNVCYIMELEKFIPFMTSDELREYEQAVITGQKPCFDNDKISTWQQLSKEREKEIIQRFNNAKSKSDKNANRR